MASERLAEMILAYASDATQVLCGAFEYQEETKDRRR
jgi:hypothetical protein